MISKKLCEISQVIMGQSPKGDSYNNDGVGMPLLNGAADYKGLSFNPKQYTDSPTRIAKKGDIILGIRATIGNFSITDKDYCIGRGVAAIRPNAKIVDKTYLLKRVESDLGKIIQRAAGSTIKGIKKEDLTDLLIPLPSHAEQKRIAKILDKADALRQKNKQLLAAYDELLQATFLDMFGDPATNPKGWKKTIFGDYIDYLADIGSNGSNENVAKNLVMSDHEDYAIMIRTLNLTRNDFTNNLKYVSKDVYEYFYKSKVFGGEIIMNKIGSAGEFWLMPTLNRPVSLGLNQFIIRLKNLNTIYLFYFLSTNYSKLNIKSRIRGATTKSITKSAVRELPLLYPPSSIQSQFAQIVENIEAQKALAKQSLKESDDLFNGLVQKAFGGDL